MDGFDAVPVMVRGMPPLLELDAGLELLPNSPPTAVKCRDLRVQLEVQFAGGRTVPSPVALPILGISASMLLKRVPCGELLTSALQFLDLGAARGSADGIDALDF